MIANLNQDDSTDSKLLSEGVQGIIITLSRKITSIIPRGGKNNQPDKPSTLVPDSKTISTGKTYFVGRQEEKPPTSRKSGGGLFANAFPIKPQYPERRGGADGRRSKKALSSKRSQSVIVVILLVVLLVK